MPNKVIIIMHIIAYLAVIIVNALGYFTLGRDLKVYEISTIVSLTVYCVCTVIFGLIIN